MDFRAVLAVLIVIPAFAIPIFYTELLEFSVVFLSAGWVFSTIYLRLLVIIFLAIALNILFSYSKRLRKIRFGVVFLIALLPGFGISFISPIYEDDYGITQNEDPPILDIDLLKNETGGEFKITGNYILVAFLSTNCGHCMALSRKLGINQKAGQTIPIHSFFPGEEEYSSDFLKSNNGQAFQSYNITDTAFISQAGSSFPSTYLIDKDGKTINHWRGDVINYSTLDYFLDLD